MNITTKLKSILKIRQEANLLQVVVWRAEDYFFNNVVSPMRMVEENFRAAIELRFNDDDKAFWDELNFGQD